MDIESLITLIPPPVNNKRSLSELDWSDVCDKLNTDLPRDYRQLVSSYGLGCFGNFFWVRDPFTSNQHLNFLNDIPRQLKALKSLEEDFGEIVPFPLFPAVGGLLPCVATDNGDVIYWLTNGMPDCWGIAVNESRGPRWESYDLNLSGFLYGILSGNVKCTIFPADIPPPLVTFQSWTD